MTDDVVVRFWGVRGSIPVPGLATLRYGGNTSCVEVRCGPHLVILDAGSGMHALGRSLEEGDGAVDADIFLSHPHLDHILGLPFFTPCYRPGNHLRLRLPKVSGSSDEVDWLRPIVNPPYFPVPLYQLGARIERSSFEPGETLHLRGGIVIRTMGLAHPGGAIGIRVEYNGSAVVYLTDVELAVEDASALTAFADGAGMLICDATFTDQESASHRNWGHSSWQEAARLAAMADVSRLILFHHAPSRTDGELDEIGWHAAKFLPGTEVASEGLTIRVR